MVLAMLSGAQVATVVMPQHGTSSSHPFSTVPLQLHAQCVVEGRQLNQGEVADLLHVFWREVSNLSQSKPAFPNNEFLQ